MNTLLALLLLAAPASALEISAGASVVNGAAISPTSVTASTITTAVLGVKGPTTLGTQGASTTTILGNLGGSASGGGLGINTALTVAGGSVTINGAGALARLEIDGSSGNPGLVILGSNGAGADVFFARSGAAANITAGDAVGDAVIRGTTKVLLSRDGGATTGVALTSVGLGIGAGTNAVNPATKLHMSSGTLTVDGNVASALIVNPTASAPPTATAVVVGSFTITSGAFTPSIKTKAQLDAITPAVGNTYLCSDCTIPYDICVATGTSLSAFRATINGSTKGCGSQQ